MFITDVLFTFITKHQLNNVQIKIISIGPTGGRSFPTPSFYFPYATLLVVDKAV